MIIIIIYIAIHCGMTGGTVPYCMFGYFFNFKCQALIDF